MEIPKLLTSIELVKIIKSSQFLNNYDDSPKEKGFITYEEKIELMLGDDETVKTDEFFEWHYSFSTNAFEGEQTEDHSETPKVVEGGMTLIFRYQVQDGEFSTKEIRDARWMFYLSLKPIVAIRSAELLRSTPIQNLTPPMLANLADFQ
ncbi:hypothetical protein [Neptunomonas japonica]|uniref:Uncharacterized protein n=1 Tax=Neptunomonas japonica JAMM 1380 TaxID=1441457 RepID=A0A7R6PJF8_9GAMM|nr:hypothetical protein [Neptunomonas japonica]BBB29351.1 hypothetical protein NEJAP_1399 [Neptunomonas japonica JAMM 1380]